MTREPKEWGFRAVSPSAVPESVLACLVSLAGVGLFLAGLLIVQQIQIHAYFASLPGENAADGRADVAASVRPVDNHARAD